MAKRRTDNKPFPEPKLKSFYYCHEQKCGQSESTVIIIPDGNSREQGVNPFKITTIMEHSDLMSHT